MWDTYATYLTILYSTYNTKLAILTHNEMLTLLKVLYSLSSYLRGKSTLTKFGHRVLVLLKPSLWIQMYSGFCSLWPKSNVLWVQEQPNYFCDKNLIVNCDLSIKYVHGSKMIVILLYFCFLAEPVVEAALQQASTDMVFILVVVGDKPT